MPAGHRKIDIGWGQMTVSGAQAKAAGAIRAAGYTAVAIGHRTRPESLAHLGPVDSIWPAFLPFSACSTVTLL